MRWEGIDEAVAIADAGSFVGAAKLLGISTSQISKVVARLESQLETTLFYRTTRRVKLTDAGAVFIDRARQLIDDREDLLSEISGSGQPQGDLGITCSIALGEKYVAPIVRRFAQANHRLSIRLELTNSVVDLIGEGFDIGIRTRHVADDRLVGRQIATRSLITCASPDYLTRAGIPESVSDLARHQCLPGSALKWHFVESNTARNFTPRGQWRCNSGIAIVDAAIAGMGICQLPEFYVSHYVADGKLVPVLTNARSEPEPIWAVYPKRRQLQPKIRKFVEVLENELQQQLSKTLPTISS